MFTARSWRTVAAVAALAVVSTRASAQIEAGDKAISLFGSLSFQNGSGGSGSTSSGTLFGSLQYFMTRQFALRVNAFEVLSTGSDGSTVTVTELGGGVEYDFQAAQNTTVPYLAFDVTASSGGGGSSSAMLSPSAGFRFFMNRNTALNLAGVYQQSTQSGAPATLMMQVGLSVFFGGDKRK
jgi:hypothetical protein